MQELLTLVSNFISQVGFPIAAFFLIWYDNSKLRELIMSEKEAHSQESLATTKALTELTDVLNQIKEKIC